MRILVLGADGYVGWPTAMHLASAGHEVVVVDNYYRRQITALCGSNTLFENPDLPTRAKIFTQECGPEMHVEIGDLTNVNFTSSLIKRLKPDAIVHCAEQPSAAYSMQGRDEAKSILDNNINVTFNIIWSVLQHAPDCHLIKIGSIGEYGTPDIPVPDGWLTVPSDPQEGEASHEFLFPREGPTIYHVSKAMSSQLLMFYARQYGLRCSNLMQGTIYGLLSAQSSVDERLLPNFYYDCIFGNVVNRFMAQAIAGVPLTVYGQGAQTRCYQHITDTLDCIEYAINNPAKKGRMSVQNQYSEMCSVIDIAQRVQEAAGHMDISVTICQGDCPSEDCDEHPYDIAHTPLEDMGLTPSLLTCEMITSELEIIQNHADHILKDKLSLQIAN
ncbi:MAG: NAD-dependent dehydratase [Robiginitomaculum sp.]|nr:MAG: NAD-dependent dehydratase [Robiginitomaculum sp.]